MATSQDFVNWICSEQLDPEFLKYLFLQEGKNLLRFASGAVHQTIYFPEVKAFHIAFPPIAEQRRIVGTLDAALEEARRLDLVHQQRARAIQELKSSFLDAAFRGSL